MSTEQEGKLKHFLKTVGNDHDLVDKWWAGGADAFKDDPTVGGQWAALTETHKGVLRRGELDEIKQALHDEAVAMGEEPSSNLGKNWALVRV